MENIENKIFGKEDLKEEFLSDLREEISRRLNYCGYDELFSIQLKFWYNKIKNLLWKYKIHKILTNTKLKN